MFPALSESAREALRTAVVELETSTPAETIRELLARGIVEEKPSTPTGARRFVFTTIGARWKLNVHVEDDEAVPCRCGQPRSRHDVRSPHPCDQGDCRSFTPARPVYPSLAQALESTQPTHRSGAA